MATLAKTRLRKPPVPKLPPEQHGLLSRWLMHMDRHLYGIGATYDSVASRATDAMRFTVDRSHVRRAAKGSCQFWRKRGAGRRIALSDSFTSNRWHRMQSWVRANLSEIQADYDTVASVCRRMRHDGVATSLAATREAVATYGEMRLRAEPVPFKLPATPPPVMPKSTPKPSKITPPPGVKLSDLTPNQKQYLQFKQQHPGYVLLFRMGDFYESFWDDARVLSRTLGVVLTTRRAEGKPEIPMAGVPFHAVEGYLRKLIAAGHKVALCEQVERDLTVTLRDEPSPTDQSAVAAVETVPNPAIAHGADWTEGDKSPARLKLIARVARELTKLAIPHVSVDEAKKALFADAKLQSFDFCVYAKTGPNWLLLCEPQSDANLPDMRQWEQVFGDGFLAVFAGLGGPNRTGKPVFLSADNTPLLLPAQSPLINPPTGA